MIVLFEISILVATTILSIIVPVFVFATTLLGSATKRVRAEEEQAKNQDKKDFEEQINSLQMQIEKAKKEGPTRELTSRLNEVLLNRDKFDKQLRHIKSKYDSIKFKGLVVYPSFFIILAIIFAAGAKVYFSSKLYLSIIYWVCYLLSFGEGVRRLFVSLLTIQEIAVTSDELRIKEQAESFTLALIKHEESQKEIITIDFVNASFPYKCKVSTNITLSFRVQLKHGKMVQNVTVWFLVPDGFDLIEPSYFWRQAQDFVRAPNIRTVKVRIGDLSIGPYMPANLKIKSPSEAGKYTLMYSIKGHGYSDSIEDLDVEVEK